MKFTDCHGEIVSTYKRLWIIAALTYPWSNISFTSRSAGVTTLPSRAQQCFKNWLCLYQSMILCTCVSIPVISHRHCYVFVSPTFPVIPTSPTKPEHLNKRSKTIRWFHLNVCISSRASVSERDSRHFGDVTKDHSWWIAESERRSELVESRCDSVSN